MSELVDRDVTTAAGTRAGVGREIRPTVPTVDVSLGVRAAAVVSTVGAVSGTPAAIHRSAARRPCAEDGGRPPVATNRSIPTDARAVLRIHPDRARCSSGLYPDRLYLAVGALPERLQRFVVRTRRLLVHRCSRRFTADHTLELGLHASEQYGPDEYI